MLTDLMLKAAKRYVQITISTHRMNGGEWHVCASVRPSEHPLASKYLPSFSFEAKETTEEKLRASLVRMLDLYEPVIAHREKPLAAHDAERRQRRTDNLKTNPVVLLEGGNLAPNTGAQS